MIALRLAIRNLLAARRRTFMLSSAIGLVTGLLILLLSMTHGIEDNLVESATTLSAGHVNVGGFYKSSPTDAAPLLVDSSELRKIVEEELTGVEYTVSRGRGWGKIISDQGSLNSGLSGINLDEEQRFIGKLQLAMESEYIDGGREEVIGDPADLQKGRGILIFAEHARTLQVKVGDPVAVQVELAGGQTNIEDFTVVAVARDVGMISAWTAVVPMEDLHRLYWLNEDTTGVVMVYLDDIARSTESRHELEVLMSEHGYEIMEHVPAPFFFKFETVSGEDWTGQKLDLTIWEDEVSFLTWVITAFNVVTTFLVAVLVCIIAVGIMNALYNAVRERTRELGTLRAMGMTRTGVLRLVLLEAAALGVFATTAGAIGGAVVAIGLDSLAVDIPVDAMRAILLSDTLRLSVRLGDLVVAVVVLSGLTVVASAWPALRAAVLPPVTAMRHAE